MQNKDIKTTLSKTLKITTTTMVMIGSLATPSWAGQQEQVIKDIERTAARQDHIAKSLWDFAEIGFSENESSALLQQELKKEGFKIKAGVAGMSTAFTATYGKGGPVIAILAEFDALPGLNQAVSPIKESIEGKHGGHGCGHNLFAAGSFGAAVAVKDWIKRTGFKGTVRLYGTPAEENGGGKAYFVQDGLFDDVDIALHWHPWSENSAIPTTSLSILSAKFQFAGKSAHAAAAPEAGRSALDGIEALNFMANLMREHVPSDTRMHYIISDGGKAPNVVPDFAEAHYFIRHPDPQELLKIWERVKAAAEGAAKGTGTKVKILAGGSLHSLLPNITLARVMDKNLQQIGGVNYNEKEQAFAEQLAKSYNSKAAISSAAKIATFTEQVGKSKGSTDVGEVSWVVPTVGLYTATWVPGTPAHSWQSTATSGMSIGYKGARIAAKAMALTAIDLFQDKELRDAARKEFDQKRGKDYKFKPLLENGPRPPTAH